MTALAQDGSETEFQAVLRLDSEVEMEYFRKGGIIPFVLEQVAERPPAV